MKNHNIGVDIELPDIAHVGHHSQGVNGETEHSLQIGNIRLRLDALAKANTGAAVMFCEAVARHAHQLAMQITTLSRSHHDAATKRRHEQSNMADLEQLVLQRVKLTDVLDLDNPVRNGAPGWKATTCPFCGAGTFAFSISGATEGTFGCCNLGVCGAEGASVVDFVVQRDKVSRVAAIRHLADTYIPAHEHPAPTEPDQPEAAPVPDDDNDVDYISIMAIRVMHGMKLTDLLPPDIKVRNPQIPDVLTGTCPFCDAPDTFNASVSKQVFYCTNSECPCEEPGDVIGYVVLRDKVSYEQAVLSLNAMMAEPMLVPDTAAMGS